MLARTSRAVHRTMGSGLRRGALAGEALARAADQLCLLDPDALLRVLHHRPDPLARFAVRAEDLDGAGLVLGRHDDAKADAHVEDPVHLRVRDPTQSLKHGEDRRRRGQRVESHAHLRLDPGQVEKAVAGDVDQRVHRHLARQQVQRLADIDVRGAEQRLAHGLAKAFDAVFRSEPRALEEDPPGKRQSVAVDAATDKPTLLGFVAEHAAPGAKMFTDEASAYEGLPFDHESVNHSAGEYVRGMAHTNGVESFWSMLKRGYQGTFHRFSEKHLDRYVTEFSSRHNDREADTLDMMVHVAQGMVGKRLMYKELVSQYLRLRIVEGLIMVPDVAKNAGAIHNFKR